jgi:hypothetical protein
LQKDAGFNRQLPDAGGTRKWTRDGYSLTQALLSNFMDVDTFNLASGRRWREGTIAWFAKTAWTGELDRLRAGLMYYRDIPADETYWWSA